MSMMMIHALDGFHLH
jgi:leucyl aminopeptidase